MKPLLSIVIPTKNRYRTLVNLVEHLLDWPSREFEVVVQDNSDMIMDAEFEVLLERKDDRLCYFHVKDPLSAIENCEFAIGNAKGEYTCFLGDDDGLIRQTLEVVKWMKDNEVDSLTCKHANYFWPDYRLKDRGAQQSLAGTLSYTNRSGSIQKLDPIAELINILQQGALVMSKIPRVYHGVVAKSALEQVKAITGSYFPGPVPDMTSSVGLSFVVKNHYYLDYPLIVAGASRNSMAGRGGLGEAHGQVEKEKSIPSEALESWSKEIPLYWAPNTIWPEGAMQSLKRLKKEEYIKYMDFNKVYYALYLDTLSYQTRLIEFLKQNDPSFDLKTFLSNTKLHKAGGRKNSVKQFVKVNSIILRLNTFVNVQVIRSKSIKGALKILEAKTERSFSENRTQFGLILSNKSKVIK
ncbi:glycosyltransferase family 2 protein [Sphingobacterium deserti]|uniref:Glycosyl transferase family 2 n=1 Tax=Sphingobacterium deserti TaxID=1229276 RepID=A0A0B8T494_9SPHI|nr:glycosyltransferase [Sphingobacterium deserti]KGE14283.1 glycosyl transferase family 2 [Sphingobacterium deserti]